MMKVRFRGMKLLHSSQKSVPLKSRVSSGQMSMTLLVNSLMVVSSISSRNTGLVCSLSLVTFASSPPALAKLAFRNLRRSGVMSGCGSLLNSSMISSVDFKAGLFDSKLLLSHLSRSSLSIHVNECLGIFERLGELDRLEEVSIAVQSRIARGDDGTIVGFFDVQGVRAQREHGDRRGNRGSSELHSEEDA